VAGPSELSLFPEDDLAHGKPSQWRDVERRENRHRKVLAGVQAELLNRGWRLRISGGLWVARHVEKGWVAKAPSGPALLERVREFRAVDSEQLGFDWK
jgi:hypothetical protein